MRRVAYVLTVLGMLCLAAGQAQAHNPNFHSGHHNAYYQGGHHNAYYGSPVIRPRVYVAPRIVVPAPAVVYPQPLYYRPCYGYPYWSPMAAPGFYYQSRGLSFGVGW
jgi:hypothetical protein